MKHCCKSMDEFVCESVHEFDPDHMIYYSRQFDEYGIIIHDGGSSYITYIIIRHCPWCGKKLPESKRDLWFDELEKLGIDSPLISKNIPIDFQSDAWWRKITQ